VDARFAPPTSADLADFSTARLLYDSARLAFRNGAGPFRALAKLSFRPRAYQIVPLIMALRQETVRLLVADDVGVGKTIEALLILRELLERRTIKRFAVVCLPHLCEQWQEEIRSKLDIEAVIIRSNTQAGLDRRIQGDASVYDYYPFQIISIDFIKSDVRRDVFVEQCPELVIVDETHTCARPTGATEPPPAEDPVPHTVDQQFRVRAQLDSGTGWCQAQSLDSGAQFHFRDGRPRNRSGDLLPSCPVDHDSCPAGRAGVADGRAIGKDEELLVHGMLRSALLPMSRALATPRAWE